MNARLQLIDISVPAQTVPTLFDSRHDKASSWLVQSQGSMPLLLLWVFHVERELIAVSPRLGPAPSSGCSGLPLDGC